MEIVELSGSNDVKCEPERMQISAAETFNLGFPNCGSRAFGKRSNTTLMRKAC